MNASLINRFQQMEAHLEIMKEHMTVLKKELEDSGASTGSARKGNEVLTPEQKAQIIGKRQNTRMRKATRQSGS